MLRALVLFTAATAVMGYQNPSTKSASTSKYMLENKPIKGRMTPKLSGPAPATPARSSYSSASSSPARPTASSAIDTTTSAALRRLKEVEDRLDRIKSMLLGRARAPARAAKPATTIAPPQRSSITSASRPVAPTRSGTSRFRQEEPRSRRASSSIGRPAAAPKPAASTMSAAPKAVAPRSSGTSRFRQEEPRRTASRTVTRTVSAPVAAAPKPVAAPRPAAPSSGTSRFRQEETRRSRSASSVVASYTGASKPSSSLADKVKNIFTSASKPAAAPASSAAFYIAPMQSSSKSSSPAPGTTSVAKDMLTNRSIKGRLTPRLGASGSSTAAAPAAAPAKTSSWSSFGLNKPATPAPAAGTTSVAKDMLTNRSIKGRLTPRLGSSSSTPAPAAAAPAPASSSWTSFGRRASSPAPAASQSKPGKTSVAQDMLTNRPIKGRLTPRL